jgi:hypothetical protein
MRNYYLIALYIAFLFSLSSVADNFDPFELRQGCGIEFCTIYQNDNELFSYQKYNQGDLSALICGAREQRKLLEINSRKSKNVTISQTDISFSWEEIEAKSIQCKRKFLSKDETCKINIKDNSEVIDLSYREVVYLRWLLSGKASTINLNMTALRKSQKYREEFTMNELMYAEKFLINSFAKEHEYNPYFIDTECSFSDDNCTLYYRDKLFFNFSHKLEKEVREIIREAKKHNVYVKINFQSSPYSTYLVHIHTQTYALGPRYLNTELGNMRLYMYPTKNALFFDSINIDTENINFVRNAYGFSEDRKYEVNLLSGIIAFWLNKKSANIFDNSIVNNMNINSEVSSLININFTALFNQDRFKFLFDNNLVFSRLDKLKVF